MQYLRWWFNLWKKCRNETAAASKSIFFSFSFSIQNNVYCGWIFLFYYFCQTFLHYYLFNGSLIYKIQIFKPCRILHFLGFYVPIFYINISCLEILTEKFVIKFCITNVEPENKPNVKPLQNYNFCGSTP